jgi:hypothetical protein
MIQKGEAYIPKALKRKIRTDCARVGMCICNKRPLVDCFLSLRHKLHIGLAPKGPLRSTYELGSLILKFEPATDQATDIVWAAMPTTNLTTMLGSVMLLDPDEDDTWARVQLESGLVALQIKHDDAELGCRRTFLFLDSFDLHNAWKVGN